jgi:hypothetical protein
MMEKHQIRCVPVVNVQRCVGRVSQADVSWSEDPKDAAELVGEVSRDTDSSR